MDLICQACLCDEDTHLLEMEGLTLRHCEECRLTSVVNPATTAVYDADYVAERYGKYATTQKMSQLRLAYVETILSLYDMLPQGVTGLFSGSGGNRLLDVGYGNGSFVRWSKGSGWDSYGNDVNPTDYYGVARHPLPDPLSAEGRYRAITFFDALEHFESLQEVRRVSGCTDWIFVTAPLPPVGWPGAYANPMTAGGEAQTLGKLLPIYEPWKHWRPGEHHHYFYPTTLEHIFTWADEKAGTQTVATLMHASHFEDSIRGKLQDGSPNTFTAALRCQTFGGLSAAP